MHNTFSQTLIPQQKTTLEQLVWSEPLPLRFLFLAYTCGMFFCCYSSSISGFSVLCFIPLLPVSSARHFHLQNICLDVFFPPYNVKSKDGCVGKISGLSKNTPTRPSGTNIDAKLFFPYSCSCCEELLYCICIIWCIRVLLLHSWLIE